MSQQQAVYNQKKEVIFTHEDWQQASLRDFLALHWGKTQDVPLPPASAVKGSVRARVNQGRWIVDCPNPECTNAMVASFVEKLFICWNCGSEDNDGQWRKVTFPRSKKRIEKLLMARPSKRPFEAVNRNWDLNESVDDLEIENVARGIF
jgi:hypothetical protein